MPVVQLGAAGQQDGEQEAKRAKSHQATE
jgi:hypothetical protein